MKYFLNTDSHTKIITMQYESHLLNSFYKVPGNLNMTPYERIFGTGPRGLLISLILLAICAFLESSLSLPDITNNDVLRLSAFGILTAITVLVLIWSVKSLTPSNRGVHLITEGAFKAVRHPLYGAFLVFFNFGLAILLNNWVYIIWAIACHPIWHWNIKEEEKLMKSVFPGEYSNYCKTTGRFFPNLSGNKKFRNKKPANKT